MNGRAVAEKKRQLYNKSEYKPAWRPHPSIQPLYSDPKQNLSQSFNNLKKPHDMANTLIQPEVLWPACDQINGFHSK